MVVVAFVVVAAVITACAMVAVRASKYVVVLCEVDAYVANKFVVVALVLVLFCEAKLLMVPDTDNSALFPASVKLPDTLMFEAVRPVLDAVTEPLPKLAVFAVNPVDDPVMAPFATFRNCMLDVVAWVVDA